MIHHQANSARISASGPMPARVHLLRCGVLLLMLALGMGQDVLAQGGAKSDRVLYPLPEPIPLLVGAEVGYGSWKNEGYFSVGDGEFSSCATFGNGTGKGMTFGVKSLIYFNSWLFISPRVRYESRSGSFTTTVPGDPVRGTNDSVITLQEEAQADATFNAAVFDLTVGVEFFRTGLYLFGGGGGALLLDGSYNYKQRIVTPGFVYGDTRSVEKTLITSQSFPTYQSTAIDLRGGVGYILRIGKLAFNPEVFYSHPMGEVLTAPASMKQTGILGTFSIMYNLGN